MPLSIRRSLITAVLTSVCLAPVLSAQVSTAPTELPSAGAAPLMESLRTLHNSVTPSFSVAPRAFLMRRGPRGTRVSGSGHSLWLSANVHDLLPPAAAKAWPAPLRLSLGRTSYGGTTPSEYVIGLDLDASRLPGSHPAWMRVKRVLHYVRLPGPALVIRAKS